MVNKKITALILAAVMAVGTVPCTVLAEESNADTYLSGESTEDDTFDEASDEEELSEDEQAVEDVYDEVCDVSEALYLGSVNSYSVNVSDLTTLKEYISRAGTNKVTINLAGDITLGDAGAITILDGQDIIINLNGHNITREGGAGQLFQIGESAVTICNTSDKESVLSGGRSVDSTDNGAAIYNKGNLTLDNITLKNNHATYDGGAVYCTSSSQLTVRNAKFIKNYADHDGGAVFCDKSTKEINISNSVFNENEAIFQGGAVCLVLDGSVNVTSCTFRGNVAREGGAVYSIKDSNAQSLSYSNCEFYENHAAVSDTLVPSSDINGRAPGGKYFYGGALCDNGNKLDVIDSIFDYNYAGHSFGNRFLVSGEAAASCGGAICSFDGTVTINGSTVISNCRTDYYDTSGGAINAWSGRGGAICMVSGKLILKEGTIKDCRVQGHGGAIYSSDAAVILGDSDNAESCPVIDQNRAEYNAGGICINGSEASLTIYNAELTNNKGAADVTLKENIYNQGGILIMEQGKLDLYGGTITGNSSRIQTCGAGITVRADSSITLHGSDVPIIVKDNYCTSGSVSHFSDVLYESNDLSIQGLNPDSEIYVIVESTDLQFAASDEALTGDIAEKVFKSDSARNNTNPYIARLSDDGKAVSFVTDTFYTITVTSTGSGSITANMSKAVKGERIYITPEAAYGGRLESIYVNSVVLEPDADGTYSFVMGAGNVTVTGVFTGVSDALLGIDLDVTQGGRITINSYMLIPPEHMQESGYSIRFTQTKQDSSDSVSSVVIPVSDGSQVTIDEQTAYKFQYSVAAKEMTDEIRIELVKDGTAQEITDGIAGEAIPYKTFKIASYANAVFDSDSTDEAKSLAGAMLNYGEYAQIHFGYATDNLPSNYIDEANKAAWFPDMTAVDQSSFGDSSYYNGTNGHVTVNMASLILSDVPYLKLYVTEDEKYTYNDFTTLTVNAEADDNGALRFRFEDIRDLPKFCNILVSTNSDTIGYIRYSPFDYCRAALDYDGPNAENLHNVVKALYCYHVAAVEYSSGTSD